MSANTFSCIVGPVQLDAKPEYGFSHQEVLSGFDALQNEIKITAPPTYNGQRFGLGVFTVFLNGNIVSKSVHPQIGENGSPEFLGYVSNKAGFSYIVSFLYGEGRCKAYEFSTSGKATKP